MGLRFVEGVDTDLPHALLGGEGLRVAPGLAAHERRGSSSVPSRRRASRRSRKSRSAPRTRLRHFSGRKYPGGSPPPGGRGAAPPSSVRAFGLVAVVAGAGIVVELEILAEHRKQVLLEPHHQRMHQRVEQDVGTLEPHDRRIARGEILNVNRRGDDGAGGCPDACRYGGSILGAEDHLGREAARSPPPPRGNRPVISASTPKPSAHFRRARACSRL